MASTKWRPQSMSVSTMWGWYWNSVSASLLERLLLGFASCVASGVNTEFPYRVRIVDRGRGVIAATLFADTISDRQIRDRWFERNKTAVLLQRSSFCVVRVFLPGGGFSKLPCCAEATSCFEGKGSSTNSELVSRQRSTEWIHLGCCLGECVAADCRTCPLT